MEEYRMEIQGKTILKRLQNDGGFYNLGSHH